MLEAFSSSFHSKKKQKKKFFLVSGVKLLDHAVVQQQYLCSSQRNLL
jgi:hypothetical protein